MAKRGYYGELSIRKIMTMRDKYICIFLMSGVCLLIMFSCASIKKLKYRKTPNEYEMSIYEKVSPYGYIDGYMAKSLYLVDSNRKILVKNTTLTH